jgi:hypothetical protein
MLERFRWAGGILDKSYKEVPIEKKVKTPFFSGNGPLNPAAVTFPTHQRFPL